MPGTPVGRFDFIVAPETGLHVEIGTAVTAETSEGPVVGTVIDMRTVGRGQDPMQEASSVTYSPDRVGYLPEVVLATVQVFNAERMRPVRAGTVRAATADEVQRATGAGSMKWPIPAGVVQLLDRNGEPGDYTPISMDGTFLLGPTGQGIIVAGRSGVASKTSYLTFLLRSVMAHGNTNGNHRVGALVFNVKGDDLVYLDQPSTDPDFTAVDHAIYDAAGVPADPFNNVTVYAPMHRAVKLYDGQLSATTSGRRDSEPLWWNLEDVWGSLHYFFDDLHNDEKLGAFIAQFGDEHVTHGNIKTFNQLDNWLENEIAAADEAGITDGLYNGTLHIATARKLRRQFKNLAGRGRGLFGAETDGTLDVPAGGWAHGQIVVLDIANLEPDVQAFVIARTVNRMMEAAENGELGVDHLAICADELNQWAPSQGGTHGDVRRVLKRVATQGRFAGLALFGAAQAASRIDGLLVENCASRAVGSSAETELTSGVHGKLPSGLVEQLAVMPNGEMGLWHTKFRAPVVVKFPRPAWQTGKSTETSAGVYDHSRRDLDPGAALAETVGSAVEAERLMDGLNPATVKSIIIDGGSRDQILATLRHKREPDATTERLYEPGEAPVDEWDDLDNL